MRGALHPLIHMKAKSLFIWTLDTIRHALFPTWEERKTIVEQCAQLSSLGLTYSIDSGNYEGE